MIDMGALVADVPMTALVGVVAFMIASAATFVLDVANLKKAPPTRRSRYLAVAIISLVVLGLTIVLLWMALNGSSR